MSRGAGEKGIGIASQLYESRRSNVISHGRFDGMEGGPEFNMEQISCHLDHIYFISQSSPLKLPDSSNI